MTTLLTTIGRRRQLPALKTLCLVDEAAQLGKLESLETAITLLRGSGLTVWTFWQDVHQIEQVYSDLPESEEEYDRQTARETLKLVLALGYRITLDAR